MSTNIRFALSPIFHGYKGLRSNILYPTKNNNCIYELTYVIVKA